MEAYVILVIGAIAGLIGLLVYLGAGYGFRQTLERKAEIREWAQSMGLREIDPPDPRWNRWRYGSSEKGNALRSEFAGVGLLDVSGAEFYNIHEGSYRNRPTRLFEHRYVVSTGKSSHVVQAGVVAMELREPKPKFELRPQTWWDGVRSFFGAEEVQIGDEELDKSLHISAEDPDYIRKLLSSSARGSVLETKDLVYLNLGPQLLVVSRSHCSTEQFERMLDAASALASKLDA